MFWKSFDDHGIDVFELVIRRTVRNLLSFIKYPKTFQGLFDIYFSNSVVQPFFFKIRHQ